MAADRAAWLVGTDAFFVSSPLLMRRQQSLTLSFILCSVSSEQQQDFLCFKEPVMRRSAAALRAQGPAAPQPPPPPKGLEAVREAASAAMLAVDAKLAAVCAAVRGGRLADHFAPLRPSSSPNLLCHSQGAAPLAGAAVAIQHTGHVLEAGGLAVLGYPGPSVAEPETAWRPDSAAGPRQPLAPGTGGAGGTSGGGDGEGGISRSGVGGPAPDDPATSPAPAGRRAAAWAPGSRPYSAETAWAAGMQGVGGVRRQWLRSAAKNSTWHSLERATSAPLGHGDDPGDSDGNGGRGLSPRGPGPMLVPAGGGRHPASRGVGGENAAPAVNELTAARRPDAPHRGRSGAAAGRRTPRAPTGRESLFRLRRIGVCAGSAGMRSQALAAALGALRCGSGLRRRPPVALGP